MTDPAPAVLPATTPHSLDGAMTRLRAFHSGTQQLSARRLVKPPADKLLFRSLLLLEEYIEWLTAAGAKDPELLIDKMMDYMRNPADHKIEPTDEFTDELDMVACADALGDITVVTLGTADTMGIPLSPVFDEIMDSNMTKIGPDGKVLRGPNGKIIKGPHYVPPSLGDILFPPH